MATILLRTPDRALAHARQAEVIAAASAPSATCTEDAYEVIVWDSQPTPVEVQAAVVARDSAVAGEITPL